MIILLKTKSLPFSSKGKKVDYNYTKYDDVATSKYSKRFFRPEIIGIF